MRVKSRWVASIGVGCILGLGGTVGLVRASTAAPVSTASLNFSVSLSGLTSSSVTVAGTGHADNANDEVSLTVDFPAAVAALIPGGVPRLQSSIGAPWVSVTLPM
jgi:hypothetical protein